MHEDKDQKFYAHSAGANGKPEFLPDHLKKVGFLAAEFASPFGASEEARVAGLLHDIGKFREEFQSYLKGERPGGVDTHHAVYGAALALQRGWPCAFAIAGHHAGLHDSYRLHSLVGSPEYQAYSRLPLIERRFQESLGQIPSEAPRPPFAERSACGLELYTRMVFSCLVDADYLATEEHHLGHARDTVRLAEHCNHLLCLLERGRASKPAKGPVNGIRNAVFTQCVRAAERDQGFFTLTVPTGGGKTLSGMAFALAHAKRRSLDRVIVVLPYLSIIEQNASEYRRILDPGSRGLVVEHHSAVPLPEDREGRHRSPLELAAENWDAPIIVTTSVQFIESLFSSSPGRCRKLHNVARSVVVLDEVQTLPTHLINPLLNVFRELKENYGVSFLFMTATQPAFRHNPISLSEGFKPGESTEIVEKPASVFDSLQRVAYRREGVLPWDALAKRMAELPQALCVVNVRRHAFGLWEALRSLIPEGERDSLFHLSSAMCAAHRLWTLGEIADPRPGSIRDGLLRGLPCRVVSTQLVEAGVDVDFPVVFRALGPLDSIVQAAGRCNREMKLADDQGTPRYGEVVIFDPQDQSLPSGVYKTATEQTAVCLTRISTESLGTDPDIFGDYFSQLFQLTSTDHARRRESTIQEDRENLRFREVSRKARVIEEDDTPVVAPYGSGKELIEEIRTRQPLPGRPRFDRHDLRRLQRFMVNVRTHDFQRLVNLHMATPLLPNLELYCLEEGCYHSDLGLLIDKRPMEDLCGV